jgi:hypothetical protein
LTNQLFQFIVLFPQEEVANLNEYIEDVEVLKIKQTNSREVINQEQEEYIVKL